MLHTEQGCSTILFCTDSTPLLQRQRSLSDAWCACSREVQMTRRPRARHNQPAQALVPKVYLYPKAEVQRQHKQATTSPEDTALHIYSILVQQQKLSSTSHRGRRSEEDGSQSQRTVSTSFRQANAVIAERCSDLAVRLKCSCCKHAHGFWELFGICWQICAFCYVHENVSAPIR